MSRPLVIHNARVIDPATGRDGPGWVRVEGTVIAEVGAGPAPDGALEGVNAVDARGRVVAPGLIDLRVTTGEPGGEHKETLASASRAAAAGGVTTIVTSPQTDPVIDDPALIDFLMRRARDTAIVHVRPSAALTRGLAGQAMTEMGLLREAGAVLFSNAATPVADARVMRRALQYARGHGVPCAVRPQDASLASGGVAHEGPFASRLGLAGVPALAEETQVARDAAIAADTGGALLLDQLSSEAGLTALSRAKDAGAPVTASVAAHQLHLNEMDVGDYRTYARLDPPLRAEEDRLALIEALRSGLLDVVVSAHDPQPPEDKRLPFAEAEPGGVGLETLLAALCSLAEEGAIPLVTALRAATSAPADVLGVDAGRLAPGAPADLVVFDPGAPWVVRRERLRSRSKNTPFDGRRVQGRALTTIVAGAVVFDAALEEAAA